MKKAMLVTLACVLGANSVVLAETRINRVEAISQRTAEQRQAVREELADNLVQLSARVNELLGEIETKKKEVRDKSQAASTLTSFTGFAATAFAFTTFLAFLRGPKGGAAATLFSAVAIGVMIYIAEGKADLATLSAEELQKLGDDLQKVEEEARQVQLALLATY